MLRFLIFLFFLLLPAGWSKHWIVPNSLVNGVLVDYLMPDVWVQDILAMIIIIANFQKNISKFRLLITDYLLPARNALLAWRAWPITLVLISVILSPISLVSTINFLRFLLALGTAWIIYKNKNLHKPALLGLSAAVVWTSFLAVGQFINQGTFIGWRFLGEPIFTSGSGGVKKIFLFGRQVVAPMAAFPHANVMGAFGLLSFLALKSKKIKYFSLILIFLSFSFPVWLTALFLLIRKSFKYKMTAGFLYFGLILLFLLTTSYQLRATSFYRRWNLFKHSLTIIKNHPFFGVGWGGFVRQLPPSTFMQPVHNVFLLILAELGIIGTGGLALLTHQFLKNFKLKNYLLLITVYLLLFSVDHYFWTTTQGIYMLWVMIALL